jgi:hypothetical protein
MIKETAVASELRWYFNQSSADMMQGSSFGSIISAAFGFSPNSAVNHIEDKMLTLLSLRKSPVKRLRAITSALSLCSTQNRRVLSALYDNSYRFPPQIVSVFAKLTGAVLFISEDRLNELQQLCRAKLTKKITPEQVIQLHDLQHNAFLLQQQAHQNYQEFRK